VHADVLCKACDNFFSVYSNQINVRYTCIVVQSLHELDVLVNVDSLLLI